MRRTSRGRHEAGGAVLWVVVSVLLLTAAHVIFQMGWRDLYCSCQHVAGMTERDHVAFTEAFAGDRSKTTKL